MQKNPGQLSCQKNQAQYVLDVEIVRQRFNVLS